MTADPTMIAAAAQDGAWFFLAIKIELPSATLRLLDAAGVVTIDGETYTGEDATYGTLGALEAVSEDMGDEAPELRMVVFPASTAATVDLVSADMQNAPVTIRAGVMDPATALPIGTPEVLFYGEVDTVTLDLGEGTRSVEMTMVSVFERLFEVDEGERATDGFHQSIYPGERGLEFMTGTEQKLYWGAKLVGTGATGSVYRGGGQAQSRADYYVNRYA